MNRVWYKIGIGIFGTILLLVIIALLSACSRGRQSERTPIHPNPNMDRQAKYLAQGESAFFADGSNMRTPVEGTVARGFLRDDDDDDEFYKGMNSKGEFIKTLPVEITMPLLNRGEERYNIYCSPCHSRLGDGRGIMVSRGYVPPPSFHDDRIRQMPDGQIFDIITHGVRNMPGYRYQIPPEDRWAIVAYLRALQKSHNATIDDVPEEIRKTVK